MARLKRILVAIKEPASRAQPALRKATQLATATGARVTIFHAITQPLVFDAFAMQGVSLQETQQRWHARVLKSLERLAQLLRNDGVAVDVACEWDFPAYEAIVRRAARIDADLIVAERHAAKHVLPWLLRFNDWELLRRSPVPVLLVKRSQPYKRPLILAALDPGHSFAKPARLDAQILSQGRMLSDSLGGQLHAVHAFAAAVLPVERLGAVGTEFLASIERQASRDAHKQFASALEDSGIPRSRRHLVSGHPVDVVPGLARRMRASVVVMGAISRSGLQRLVIGNIAEQVLDALPCDVLVLKPAGFHTRVKGKSRGVQLIATPPVT